MNTIKSIFWLLTLTLIACNDSNDKEVSSEIVSEENNSELIQLSKTQYENAEMELGKLTKKPFAEIVKTNGMIDVPPQSKAVISAFSGGYIKNTALLVGDKVSKGQRLVILENPEFIKMQQDYLETVEQLSYLKSEYDRQKIMFDEKITSQKSFLKSESDYKSNLARYNSLKKNLEMLHINPVSVEEGKIVSQVNIYSPIDGYVTQIFVNTGTYVSPADKIMEIMNTDHIHLELKIFEKDLLQLKKGQEILFTVPEASKETFDGEVHLIGTTIDTNTRIAMVHGHIDEKDEQNFTTGMFVEAQIVTGKTEHFALPEDAVIEIDGKTYVLILENEDSNEYKFNSLEVNVKMNYQGFTSFEENEKLTPDARYLTKGGFVLLQN